MRSYLLEALVTNYLRLVNHGDSNFVLQKLASTLVTFFTKLDSGWTCPFRHLLICFLNGNYVKATSLPEIDHLLSLFTARSEAQLSGAVMLVTVMAEDLNSHSSNDVDEGQVRSRLAANCFDALQILKYCFVRDMRDRISGQQIGKSSTTTKMYQILQLVMKAIPYWFHMVRYADEAGSQSLESTAKDCIVGAVNYLEDDAYASVVLQMLIPLENSSSRLLREALPNFPSVIATSLKLREIVEGLIQGDFSTEGVLYVDLLESIMSKVDTTKPGYLHNRSYTDLIQIMQRLLRCDGLPVIEDSVCQIVLEKFSEMVEGYTDWEDADELAQGFLRNLTADACDACVLKIKIPEQQMSSQTQNWDADDRAKFQDFRYDVHDFFQSAFAILGNALIKEIVKAIIGQETSPDWRIFEAGTFILIAFSDTLSSNPETYDALITTVLGSGAWTYLLNSTTSIPDRALQTGIKFIAENVGYLQRYPDRLVPILNFLFSSLNLQPSTSAASRAIYSLCDLQRELLTEGLPQFLQILPSIGDIGEAERHRVYASVAAIIQALPTNEAKVQPVGQLLGPVHHTLQSLSSTSDQDEIIRGCIDIVQTLAFIGKGLRSPADVPVDLEAPNTDTSDFWTDGSGAVLQRDVLSIYGTILGRCGSHGNSIFIDASCDFIRSGFTEIHPSPFKFPDSVGLELVTQLINLDNPSIDNAMSCASSYLASVERHGVQSSFSGILYAVSSNQQRVLRTFQQTNQLPSTTFPSCSLDFLGRTLHRWGAIWFSMQDSQETAAVAVELALILMADADTLPRRSAASFLASFAKFTGPETGLEGETKANVHHVLHSFGPRTLALLLRLLGGECARSELESLTDSLKQFVQKQNMLTKTVLREAVKDEAGVMSDKALEATTLEQRNRFLAQVEALRGARRTNDIVKEFWIACRGSGFRYIT